MKNLIKKLNYIEEGCVAFSLLGIAVVAFIQTALRYTVGYTFAWFQELANYTIIFTVFLGASIGAKYGIHFSMEALTQSTPDRVSHLLKGVAYLLSGIIACFFVYFGTKHIFTLKNFGVTSSAMQIPMYIPYIPIPLFSVTMAFRFFVLSAKHMRSCARGEPFERIIGKKR